jgi:hypothetical protein
VDVTAFVDGEEVPLDLGAGTGTVRVRTVSFVRTFISGTHEVRIQARDERGQFGGYRWQFSIGTPRQQIAAPPTIRPAAATPAVQPRPTIPIPTRRPTSVSAPPPAAGTPPVPAVSTAATIMRTLVPR